MCDQRERRTDHTRMHFRASMIHIILCTLFSMMRMDNDPILFVVFGYDL